MGVKRNIIYSTVLTVSGYLFPLITFPYVTRVLGVNNFGICNFYDGVVSYFILFSMLGILNLGIREIARVKNDKRELTKVFGGLITLNLLTTALSIVALLIVGLTVPKLAEHPQMIYIGAAKVLVNTLLVEWFYKGMEDFRYITVRSILVRSVYVAAVFLFVRDSNDYILYFGLTTGMFVVNSLINVVHLRKFIHFSGINFNFKQFVKPYIILGIYQILTSMYTTVNVVILGFMAGDVQVGYYSTSVKLYYILLSFYSAFSGVLLPRMSTLLAQNDKANFHYLISKSSSVLFIITIPLIIIIFSFSPTIINLIAGPGFGPASDCLRIIIPMMLIHGFDMIVTYQILFPMNQDRPIFINSVIGAVVGLSLNFILVPHLLSIGSSIVLLCSETAVFASALYFVSKISKFDFKLNLLLKIVLFSVPVILIIVVTGITGHQTITAFALSSALIGAYFVAVDIFSLKILGLNKLLARIKKSS